MKLLLLIVAGFLAWFFKNQIKEANKDGALGKHPTAVFLVLWFVIFSIGFPVVSLVFTDTMSAEAELPVKVDAAGNPVIDPSTGHPVLLPTENKELETMDYIKESLVAQLGDLVGLDDLDGDGFSDSQEVRLRWNPSIYTLLKKK